MALLRRRGSNVEGADVDQLIDESEAPPAASAPPGKADTEEVGGPPQFPDAAPEGGGKKPRLGISSRTKNFDTNNVLRRNDRWSRTLMFLMILSVLSNFVLANVIYVLFPLKRDIPYLVTASPALEQVMEVEPLRTTASRLDIIAKAAAMKYVRTRHEVVPDSGVMNMRWGVSCLKGAQAVHKNELCGYVFLHSSRAVYRTFVESNQGVEEMIERKVRREVDFTQEPLKLDNGVILVRFALRDYQVGRRESEMSLIKETYQSAHVWYEFKKLDVERHEQYLNPFGFTVTEFQRAEQQRNAGRTAANN